MIYESTPKQRQLIGYFRKLLCIDEDTYYDMLAVSYGAGSSKELNIYEADELLNRLKKQAAAAGKHDLENDWFYKYSSMTGRYGMCTAKQLRYINVLWKQVSKQPTNEGKEKALNAFIKRITGKERLQFLTQSDAKKVIKAINVMLQDKERTVENGTN